MTTINRQTSSSSSTASTASTTKTPTTSTPPVDDHDVEALPQTASSSTTASRRASPEEIAAAKAATASVKDDASAEDAAIKLIRLPNADFAAALKDVAATPGQLENLLAKVPESTKEVIQRRLVRSGVLQPAVTPPSTPTPPKAPTPPAAPVVLKDDPALPSALRQLAADENAAKLKPWKQEVAVYREAYGAAVDNAKSVGELRALGPMQAPNAPANQPSTTGAIGGPYNAQYEKARGADVIDIGMTTRVADKARELSGRPVAGMSIKLGAEALVTLDGISSFGLDVEVSRSASGTIEKGAKARFGAGGAEVGVNDKGEVEGELEVGDYKVTVDKDGVELDVKSNGPPTPGSSRTGHDKKKDDDSSSAVGGVTLGKEKVGIKAGMGGTDVSVGFSKEKGFEAELDMGIAAGKGSFNGDAIGYGLKVGNSVEIGDVELELAVEAELGLQGVTKADRDAFVSTSTVGFYDVPPPKLLEIPWSKLPTDVRDVFKNQMWTEPEWSAANKRNNDLKLRH